MEKRTKALVLKFPGTNCDEETAEALTEAGFHTVVRPLSVLTHKNIFSFHLIVLPGGFSYGDYILAGKLAQLELHYRTGDSLREFVTAGGYVLGICNGFQILLHLGLLPEGALIPNASGTFICRWVGLRKTAIPSPFLNGLPSTFELPVAHAEGRFVSKRPRVLLRRHIALQYMEEVNGSLENTAALRDDTGRVFGIMPHPERFIRREQHYDRDWSGHPQRGWGYFFFKSMYDHISREAP